MSRISRSDDRPLYGLLGVSSTATDAEIARGYRRLALQFHPDRNPDGAEKFKELSSAYAILSDKEKRSLYDLTGVVPGSAEDPNGPEGGDAESMADRSNTIKEQLEAFFKTYAGSDEERADFVKGFDKTGGNFRKMVREHLIFDNGVESEVARLHRLGTALIREGRLRATEAWSASTTPQGIRKAEKDMRREREEADDVLREMGLDEESQRRRGRRGKTATLARCRRLSRTGSASRGRR